MSSQARDSALARARARQQADGAVARLEGGAPADLGSTAEALEGLADLRLLELPCAEQAARFVLASQLSDGSFGPAEESEREARLQLCGRLAPVLARMLCVPLDGLEALGAFLAASFSVERVQRGGYEDLAPFLPFFAIHPHELSDAALQWCGRELERSFRGGRLSALEAGRIFVRSDAISLPATRLDGSEIVPALLASQHADGSFGDGAAEAGARLGDTLDAVLLLLRLG
jgi:hypothetical protein